MTTPQQDDPVASLTIGYQLCPNHDFWKIPEAEQPTVMDALLMDVTAKAGGIGGFSIGKKLLRKWGELTGADLPKNYNGYVRLRDAYDFMSKKLQEIGVRTLSATPTGAACPNCYGCPYPLHCSPRYMLILDGRNPWQATADSSIGKIKVDLSLRLCMETLMADTNVTAPARRAKGMRKMVMQARGSGRKGTKDTDSPANKSKRKRSGTRPTRKR